MYYYGGQALIEGVMMRGRHQVSAVVRGPDGQTVTRTDALPETLYQRPIARLPFVRGLVMLWEMMVLGTRMMLFSANVQARATTQEEIPRGLMAVMFAVAAVFAVGVFFVLPLLLTRAGGSAVRGSLAANGIEGLLRLALFIGYLSMLGQLGRMKRVFQYHGAEHKTINAYEHGAELTPASVQRFSTIHIRCGTAFLLWVVILSIFVFALVGHQSLPVSIGARILLVPFIAAISYEILRFGARYYHIVPVRLLVQPGLWLQRLTTRQPTDDQVEIAIAALRQVLIADGVVITPMFDAVAPALAVI
jgi:uncharacterized protein YqhQ